MRSRVIEAQALLDVAVRVIGFAAAVAVLQAGVDVVRSALAPPR